MSITASTASRVKYKGLAVIKCLINTRRLYSYPILIKWTALELVCCFTKSIIACSVSLNFIYLIVLNYLLLDTTGLRDSLNKT
jgi:heme/copper-type cytochrome/quinol oxidase subunit 1